MKVYSKLAKSFSITSKCQKSNCSLRAVKVKETKPHKGLEMFYKQTWHSIGTVAFYVITQALKVRCQAAKTLLQPQMLAVAHDAPALSLTQCENSLLV